MFDKEVLHRYDQIIEFSQADQLLPFLQRVDKKDYEPLRKHIKKANEYWDSYVDLLPEEQNENAYNGRRRRGSDEQCLLVTLSGIALLPLKELQKLNYFRSTIISNEYKPVTQDVLQWAKPNWLTNYFAQQINNWWIMPYEQLRDFENRGIIHYTPELFAKGITFYRTHTYAHNKTIANDATSFIALLTNDTIVIQREIPTLFDYQTNIDRCSYSLFDEEKKHFVYFPIWPDVFAKLLADNKIERLWFFEKCLSVQTKDWTPNLKAFFRKQIEAAKPTTAEYITLQNSLFPLLAAQQTPILGWALTILKKLCSDPAFEVSEFLTWSTSLMMRNDAKTALKTQLGILEKLLKNYPEHRSAISLLLADVMAVNDLSLQTKAAQLLTNYAPADDQELSAYLQTYKPQMLGTVSVELRNLLGESSADVSNETEVPTYQYAPLALPRLVADQAVSLPTNWPDFMFLIGRFIGSESLLDAELLMNALIAPPVDMPADYQKQLRPYQKQLEKAQFSSDTKRLLSTAVLAWISGDKSVPWQNQIYSHSSSIRLQYQRFRHLQYKWQLGSRLPLLSLPTHAPHWIAPKTLLERIVAYRQANEPIKPLDLAIAIARMPRENVAEALPLCDALEPPLAELMRYCLGQTQTLSLPSDASQAYPIFDFNDTVLGGANALDIIKQLQPYSFVNPAGLPHDLSVAIARTNPKVVNDVSSLCYSAKFDNYAFAYRIWHYKWLADRVKESSLVRQVTIPARENGLSQSPADILQEWMSYSDVEKNNSRDLLLDIAQSIIELKRENVTELLPLYEILDKALVALVEYIFGASSELKLPSLSVELPTLNTPGKATYTLKALWAVAARTYSPEGTLTALENTPFASLPNVVNALEPAYYWKENWYAWENYQTKQQERSPSWWEPQPNLPLTNGPISQTAQLLLYSNDLCWPRHSQTNYLYGWDYANLTATDVAFWYSLIPQQPEGFYTMLVKNGCRTSENEWTLEHGLAHALQPDFRFGHASVMTLACALVNKKKETSMIAAEVLIQHLGQQSVPIDQLGQRLGWLLAKKYAPLQRLVNSLQVVRDVSPLHNQGLKLLFDALFCSLAEGDDIPANTRKLLELYLDALVRTAQKPTQKLAGLFQKWQTNNSLKRLCISILNNA